MASCVRTPPVMWTASTSGEAQSALLARYRCAGALSELEELDEAVARFNVSRAPTRNGW